MPGTSKPGAARPDGGRPDIAGPDPTRPLASRPDVYRPGVSRPGASSRPGPPSVPPVEPIEPLGPEESGGRGGRRFVWITVAGVLLLVAAVSLIAIYGRPSTPRSQALPGSSTADGASGGPVASGGVSPSLSASAPGQTPSGAASAKAGAGGTTPKAPPAQAAPPGCASNPGKCGFPDAGNTGVPAGTALSVLTGDQKITTAGTVIEGKDIRGCVTIMAPNVTIRKSKISCSGYYGIWSYGKNYSGGGLLIEDVEVDCKNTNATGVASYGLVARRLNVHGCENGFAVDNTVTVENSYIHDFFIGNGGHTDGLQLAGGAHIVIRHNTIMNQGDGGTSAIISNETGMSDVLIASNLMAGGAYTLYCPRDSSSNFRVTDNRVSRIYSSKGGEYGPWVYCQQVAQVSGNVWDNDLSPLG